MQNSLTISEDFLITSGLQPDIPLKKLVSASYVKSIVVVPAKTLNTIDYSALWLQNHMLLCQKNQYPYHFYIDTTGAVFQLLPLDCAGEVLSYLDQDSWYIGVAGGQDHRNEEVVNFNEKQIIAIENLIAFLAKKQKNLFKRFLFKNSVIALRI